MTDIKHNLNAIFSEIDAIDSPNGKPKIIAVSKKQPLEKIKKLYELGKRLLMAGVKTNNKQIGKAIISY